MLLSVLLHASWFARKLPHLWTILGFGRHDASTDLESSRGCSSCSIRRPGPLVVQGCFEAAQKLSLPKFWKFCPPIAITRPPKPNAAGGVDKPLTLASPAAHPLPCQLTTSKTSRKRQRKTEREKPDPNVISRPRTRSIHTPVRGESISEALQRGLTGSRFSNRTVPQVTMAETSVPPPPPSTVSRPVSEALLNEKVSFQPGKETTPSALGLSRTSWPLQQDETTRMNEENSRRLTRWTANSGTAASPTP